MKSVASERLLETLNWWKALNYRREMLMPITHPNFIGPVTAAHLRRWRNYEKMVLDNRIENLDFREWAELPSQREDFDFLCALEMFPCELFEWNRKSRRVFHLPKGLQYLLTSGCFNRLKWEDVLWPYDSIALTLEQPIELEEAPNVWSSFDTILASHVPIPGHGKTLRIRLLRKPEGTMLGVFPERRRNLVERHLATGDVVRAQRVLGTTVRSIIEDAGGSAQGFRSTDLYTTIQAIQNIPQMHDRIGIELDEFVAEHERVAGEPVDDEQKWRYGYLSLAAKLVVGWALYMETISTNAFQNIREPKAPPTHGMAGIITSPEHICNVLVQGRLDPARYVQTPEFEVTSSMFKRPHWRRGHKKRERGAGPQAPKTIRVPPQLIRIDLIPLFGIISGTATWIEEDD